MKFALLGGDARFQYLNGLLRGDGHTVDCFALAGTGDTGPEEALSGADCVILPLPSVRDGVLNAPTVAEKYPPAELLGFAPSGAAVFAGAPPEELRSVCRRRALALWDYSRRESFALRNAELTAEGTLPLLLDGPGALRGSRILIAGYGRIGRALAAKLSALGVRVTVAARGEAARTAAELAGLEALPIPRAAVAGFDAVVNTIPEPVFGTELLERFRGARLLELASPPYGFDPEAARSLGLEVCLAAGLPGKTAPAAAAAVIQKTVYEILEESGIF